jgi:hypothetical protein
MADSIHVPFPLMPADVPLGLDQDPLEKVIRVPHEWTVVARRCRLMDRRAEATVLHDGIETREPLDRTEEGDQSDRSELAHSGNGGEELSFRGGLIGISDRPIE